MNRLSVGSVGQYNKNIQEFINKIGRSNYMSQELRYNGMDFYSSQDRQQTTTTDTDAGYILGRPDHFTMTTHLSSLVTLTWLRIIDNSLWKTFDNLDLSLVTSRRDHLWKILNIWLAIWAWYLLENNITLKYHNTFMTVTSDRKEGKSGLFLANIAIPLKWLLNQNGKKTRELYHLKEWVSTCKCRKWMSVIM